MLRLSKGRMITLVVILVLAGLGYGIYQAGLDDMPPPGSQSTTILGGQAIGNRLKSRSWSFDYDRMNASNDGTYIQAQGIHHGVIFRKGKPPIHLGADHVMVNLATKDLQIDGHVHIEMGIGGELRSFDTSAATWTEHLGTLVMPGLIHISDRKSHIDITGATVDTHTGHTHLGRLTGALHAPESHL